MKFDSVRKGKRAEKKVAFPYPGEDGANVDIPVLVTPLTGTEESDTIAFAIAYAKGKGVESPRPLDPLYDIGFIAQALAFAVLDAESPERARERFFTSPEQILDQLSRDQRVYLYELLDAWQDECSPSIMKMTGENLLQGCAVLARGGSEAEDFLDRLTPALQRSYLRFTGSQLWSSLEGKSLSGSASTTDTTTS